MGFVVRCGSDGELLGCQVEHLARHHSQALCFLPLLNIPIALISYSQLASLSRRGGVHEPKNMDECKRFCAVPKQRADGPLEYTL